ncbi:hypothetical protein CHUAL_012834 [Chamberlinius hualienensis]
MFGIGCALWLLLLQLSITSNGQAYYLPPDPPEPPPQTQPPVKITQRENPATSTIATTTTSKPTTAGGFFPADLKLDVRAQEGPASPSSAPDSSSILFPGSANEECPSSASCVIIDQCPANSRGKSICGWEDTMPLICCSQSSTNLTTASSKPESFLLTKEIFPEDQCFQLTKTKEKRIKREFPNNNPFEVDFKVNETIIGGKDVESNTRWPFMVGIYKQVRLASAFLCGGIVIGRSFALSAAHCFMNRDDDGDVEFVIRSGMIDLASVQRLDVDIVIVQIDKIVVHPEFQFPILYNDIAVLKFKKPVEFTEKLRPVCLPPATDQLELDVGNATVIGWGAKKFGGSESTILQEATVKLVGRNECDTAYEKLGVAAKVNFPQGIIADQICAGNVNKPKDACQGDSGGPLVHDDNGLWRLIGLVSVGFECGRVGFPGIYTRVDHFLSWINETVSSI